MSSFTQPLQVKVLDDGAHYELLEPFLYYREHNKNSIIVVPKGYVTDFASVPRIFWSIYPPFGRYSKAAVLHDYLCDHGSEININRKQGDDIFLEAMKAVNVPVFTRTILYSAVRLYAIIKRLK